ncbi:hypothetical protein DFH29DRAFT_877374 [Suillus ampliporus]|nr:hypothetical protein DFH29DRAFT_877374 [Suillus ampliporus]
MSSPISSTNATSTPPLILDGTNMAPLSASSLGPAPLVLPDSHADSSMFLPPDFDDFVVNFDPSFIRCLTLTDSTMCGQKGKTDADRVSGVVHHALKISFQWKGSSGLLRVSSTSDSRPYLEDFQEVGGVGCCVLHNEPPVEGRPQDPNGQQQ